MAKFRCYDIDWDVSGTDAKATDLPTEVVIETEILSIYDDDEEAINDLVIDALTEEVGFCVNGACIDRLEE